MAITPRTPDAAALTALNAAQAARKAQYAAHNARLLAEGETLIYTELTPVEITQAEYDSLASHDPGFLYVIVG